MWFSWLSNRIWLSKMRLYVRIISWIRIQRVKWANIPISYLRINMMMVGFQKYLTWNAKLDYGDVYALVVWMINIRVCRIKDTYGNNDQKEKQSKINKIRRLIVIWMLIWFPQHLPNIDLYTVCILFLFR